MRLVALNVNGIRNDNKRERLFKWLVSKPYDLYLIQETHCTDEVEEKWKRQWKGVSLWNNGDSNSRGVAMLFKQDLDANKISIRNIRRDANEELKRLLKSKEIGEDEEKSFEKNVQNITDKHIQIVDEKVSSKEKEIMTI